jgi:GTP-binding protein
MLTHNPKLAKTSQKPGKTLLINHFLINAGTDTHWHLVDLPGYGFAQAGKKQRAKLKMMIERYCLLREALVSLFVLVDCRHEPQQIDLEFMEWLGENEIPFAIIFTKADKLGKGKLTANVESYKQKLLETWAELPPIFVTSAEKGLGEAEVIAYIEGINRDLTNRS